MQQEFLRDSFDGVVHSPVLRQSRRRGMIFGFTVLDSRDRVPGPADSNQYIEELSSSQSFGVETPRAVGFEDEPSWSSPQSHDVPLQGLGVYGLDQFSWSESDLGLNKGELSTVYQSALKSATDAAEFSDHKRNISFAPGHIAPNGLLRQSPQPATQRGNRKNNLHLILNCSSAGKKAASSSFKTDLAKKWDTTYMENYFLHLSNRKEKQRSISPLRNFFSKPTRSHQQYLTIIKGKVAQAEPTPRTPRHSNNLQASREASRKRVDCSTPSSGGRPKGEKRLPAVTEFQTTIKPIQGVRTSHSANQRLLIRERRDSEAPGSRRIDGVGLKKPVWRQRVRHEYEIDSQGSGAATFSIYLSNKFNHFS